MVDSKSHIIKPFRALRPCHRIAKQFICPPYDVINEVEAKNIIAKNPLNFLHIVKPEVSFDSTMQGCIYSQAKTRLHQIIESGYMKYEQHECYYIYRLQDGTHKQTSIVALVSADSYKNNKIKPHEKTLPDKLFERTCFTNILKIQTGPTMLFYRNTKKIKRLMNSLTEREPDINIEADDGIKHTLWLVNDKNLIEKISQQFNAINELYIADGHHRIEAVANLNNPFNIKISNTIYDYFLAAMFPEDDLKIISYNRIIKEIKNFDPKNILKVINSDCYVEPIEDISKHENLNILMYLDRAWYTLSLKSKDNRQQNYQNKLREFETYISKLIESLGISCNKDYVPGSSPVDFANVINNTKNAFGFFLAPVSIFEILEACDAGLTMPPKSTYFTPKLADGLITYIYDY